MSKNSKFSNFMNGKGFYAALALCLVGAGTAAWVVVDRTLGSITDQEPASSQQSISSSHASSWGFPQSEEADNKASNIEISSASSLPEPTSSSSAAPSSEAVAPQEQQVLSPEQPTLAFVLPVASAEAFNDYSGGELVKNTTLNKWCTHDGIDFKAAQGEQVMAVADGVVSRVYDDGIWGKTVEISHDGGYTSIYSGLSSQVAVAEGDTVTVEQVIATVGDSNLAEAKLQSHLHFAMQKDGSYVDPLSAMNKR